MATWLVHLRVAEKVLERVPLSRRDFLVGNIAPDCGRPDKNGGFDPPKEVTHWTKNSKGNCDYNAFSEEMFPLAKNERERAFLLGYYSHLVTDCLWVRLINDPCKEKYRELYTRDRAEYYRLVKADWYDNDAAFLAAHPNLPILAELAAVRGYDSSVLPYYGSDNVQLQIDRIAEFYRTRRCDGRSFVYITPKQIDEFVAAAANEVLEKLKPFL